MNACRTLTLRLESADADCLDAVMDDLEQATAAECIRVLIRRAASGEAGIRRLRAAEAEAARLRTDMAQVEQEARWLRLRAGNILEAAEAARSAK